MPPYDTIMCFGAHRLYRYVYWCPPICQHITYNYSFHTISLNRLKEGGGDSCTRGSTVKNTFDIVKIVKKYRVIIHLFALLNANLPQDDIEVKTVLNDQKLQYSMVQYKKK